MCVRVYAYVIRDNSVIIVIITDNVYYYVFEFVMQLPVKYAFFLIGIERDPWYIICYVRTYVYIVCHILDVCNSLED